MKSKGDEVALWQGAILDAISESGLADHFFFHGTSDSCLEAIQREGLATTEVLLRYHGDPEENGEPQTLWSHGTYWATARLAAHYAADTALNRGGKPVLIAALRDCVWEEGELVADELTLDFPPCPLLEQKTPENLADEWVRAPKKNWNSFFEIFETVVCLAPVGPERLLVLRSRDCVEKLAECLSSQTRLSP